MKRGTDDSPGTSTQREADLVADVVREQLRNSIDNIHSELEQLYQEELTTHKSQLQAAHEKLRQRRRSDLARRMQESHRLQALKEAKAETDDSRKDKMNQFKEKMRSAAEKSLSDEGMVLQRLRPSSSGQDGRALTPLSDQHGGGKDVGGLRIRSTFEEQLAAQQRVLSSHMHAMRALHSQRFFPPSPVAPAAVVQQQTEKVTEAAAPAAAAVLDSSLFGARAELRKLREEMLWLAPEEFKEMAPAQEAQLEATPPTSSRPVLPPLGKVVKSKVMAKLQEVEAREVLEAKASRIRNAGALPFEDAMHDGRIIQETAHENNKRYDEEAKKAQLERDRVRAVSIIAAADTEKPGTAESRVRASFVTFDAHDDSADGYKSSSFQSQESLVIAQGSMVLQDADAAQRESDRQAFQHFQQQRIYNRKLAEQRAQLSSLRSKLEQLMADSEASASPNAKAVPSQREAAGSTVSNPPDVTEPVATEVPVDETEKNTPPPVPSPTVEVQQEQKCSNDRLMRERRDAAARTIQRLARRYIARAELLRRRENLKLALRAKAAALAEQDAQEELELAQRGSLVHLVPTNGDVGREGDAHGSTLKPSELEAELAAVDKKEEAELLAAIAEHEAYIDLLHRETLLCALHEAAARRIQLFVREQFLLRRLKAKKVCDAQRAREALAVGVLQRWFRSFIQTAECRHKAQLTVERRRRLAKRYEQASGIANVAASCIQNLARRKRAARHVSQRRDSRPSSRLIIESEAALLIQKHFRRFLQRDTVRQRWTARLLRDALERADAERRE